MLVKKGTKLNHSNSRAEFVPTDAAIKSARAVFQMKLSTSETKVCSVLLFFPVLLLLPRFYHLFNLNLVSLDKLYVWTSVVSYRWLRFNWRGSSMISSNILLNITETLRTSKGVSNKAQSASLRHIVGMTATCENLCNHFCDFRKYNIVWTKKPSWK